MPRQTQSALLLAMIALICTVDCRADVFSYTDVQGVVHFSNVPADGRYRLLIASPATPRADRRAGQLKNWLVKSITYDSLIENAALANTINPALIRALIVVESGFNPRAVSKRGAIGLMQLRPETARRYGVSNIYDPAQNIRAGTRYLSDLMALYDSDTELALAAYNAGEAAVARYGGHIPPFKETLEYVPSVLKIYHALVAQEPAGERS
jgi:soluble lytic murein transglycosylase-like protein